MHVDHIQTHRNKKRKSIKKVMANKTCVYFFPVYAAGHLIAMIEFAKRLSTFGNSFSIHFLLILPDNPNHGSPLCSSYLQSLQAQNTAFQFHPLPSVEPPTTFNGTIEFLSLRTRSYMPHVKEQLLASPSPITALVLDVFASDAIDVANELSIPSYIYYTSNATSYALMSHFSCQKEENNPKDNLKVEAICVPGLVPIPLTCIEYLFSNRKSTFDKWFMHYGRRSNEAKAVILNSNNYLEKTAVEALVKGTPLAPDTKISGIYPIGPVISSDKNKSQEHECLKWLDRQPMKSVVFLCFGSTEAFDVSQSRQIASALEQSGHRFLWAIRTPSNEFLGFPTDGNLGELLPGGFIERTKERGLVWPSLVPQTDILSHEAIGGFVTHCGWNSCLESLWFGVPMVPWPLHFEQHLNAFQLVNEMHVAIALELDRKEGFVSAKELERAIKCLMDEGSEEGRSVRKNAEEIKLACRKAVEVGGVSYVHLQNLAIELGWKEVHSQST
ncbi:UDP-glycosyltransferase 71K2 [Rhynchospora pubera]|uniref:UDP-glycosyltransferase 71K2 n=1 Tax=Rhynchospora pubera TaxID=906938 RepID=A0AAV8H1F1_9POAL|nr:UDP-glycosyltransferase 71K2 [Rhynchospora pubera]